MQNKTYSIKKEELNPSWHLIDAKGKVLGRIATEISKLLMGKEKTSFTPHMNVGDKVVVINAQNIEVTGRKLSSKLYSRHSGFPGGYKEEVLEDLLVRKPEDVILKAVKGMLPVNKLREVRLRNLYVYKGSEHPHSAQLKKGQA